MQVNLSPGIPFFGLDEEHAATLRQALRSLPRVFSGDSSLRTMLHDAFYALSRENRVERCLGEQMIACALWRMKKLSQKMSLHQSDSIADAIAFIHDNLTEPIQLEDAAACCGLSLSRFKVKFKEETGATPREYINHVKIEQAKRLLEAGRSVTDTALDLGFTTSNYFSVIFKKYTGKTPTQYEVEYQNKKQ